MEDKEKKEDALQVLDTVQLDSDTQAIANQIIHEPDGNKVKQLIDMFNLNQKKKNVIRLIKFNGLLDTVSDSMIERFQKKPGEFGNQDLLNYMSVVQNAIDRVQKSVDSASDMPAIQFNQQNNVNIETVDMFDKEAKEKIATAIKAILNKSKEYKDIELDTSKELKEECTTTSKKETKKQ